MLTGLAAKCGFGDQTESLVMDTFIQNMNNKTVQERLCTEAKNDPQEAFRFAVAYEEGVNQHKTYEGRNAYQEIKQEPVFARNERKNPCTRCGLEFSNRHSAECKAKPERCRNCALIGHFAFARMCKKPKSGNFRCLGRNNHPAGMNLIGQDVDQSDASKDFHRL